MSDAQNEGTVMLKREARAASRARPVAGKNPTSSGPIQDNPRRLAAEAPTVFFLPGLGGHDDPALNAFRSRLRGVLSIVPIHYPEWTELAEPGTDFAALVANVKLQIEREQPAGPVRLAGYSIGGHIAYACARAFEEQGRATKCVAIFDAPADVEGFVLPLSTRLRRRIARLLTFDPQAAIASLLAKCLTKVPWMPWLREVSLRRRSAPPSGLEAALQHKLQMQMVLKMFPPWWRRMCQTCAPLSAPAFLFRCEEHEPGEREDLGWGTYFRDVTVLHVQGSHGRMLDPDVNGPLREAFLKAMMSGEPDAFRPRRAEPEIERGTKRG